MALTKTDGRYKFDTETGVTFTGNKESVVGFMRSLDIEEQEIAIAFEELEGKQKASFGLAGTFIYAE